MSSVSNRVRSIEVAARKAFATADAAIASLPDATITKARGLGDLILSAATHAATNPRAQADAIAKRLESDIEAALALLDSAQHEGQTLMAVAEHLETGKALPDDLDTALAAHAKQVRAADRAGLIDGRAVAQDIRRYASEANAEIKRLQNTLAASTRSAARVVASKALHSAYLAAGMVKSAETAKLRVIRTTAVHRAKFEFNDRSRPRTAKRFQREVVR